jgi:protein-tyrosine phosphatase
MAVAVIGGLVTSTLLSLLVIPVVFTLVDDFARFDMILVMDWLTMRALQNIAPEQYRHKIELVMRYAQNSDDAEIPDPFYLEQEAFNQAVDYMEDAALGLLDLVKRRLPQPVAA